MLITQWNLWSSKNISPSLFASDHLYEPVEICKITSH